MLKIIHTLILLKKLISLSSQLNDLKSQHIATEVTSIDNKTKKNASDINRK